MLHLYRLYNLHPVIHENLRPEKPPKPFPRACVGEDGEAGENGSQSTPRKRRTRAKAKAEEDTEGMALILSLLRMTTDHHVCLYVQRSWTPESRMNQRISRTRRSQTLLR